jgi:hypothetical protein
VFKVILAQRASHFYDLGNEKIVMVKLFAIVAVATVATLTASPVFAAVKHRAERPTVERTNRSNLYQSDAQGNQPYSNPDRELYVNRSCC